MIILGIETSCDETGVAILKDGKEILCNLVASQVELHKKYGGVVPEVASRCHLEVINPLLETAFKQTKISFSDISCVAVCYGPGLEGSLLIGVSAAKTISCALNIPLIGINHIESHIYANFIENDFLPPYLCLVVSGGHSDMFILDNNKFKIIGRTRDDAAGEVLDKAAKILGLSYPGGPIIDKLSKSGDPEFIKFPQALLNEDNFDFSFSGLKTSLLNWVNKNKIYLEKNPEIIFSVCASYQKAIVDVLVKKLISASIKFNIKNILIGGGVAVNSKLREELKKAEKENGVNIYIPSPLYCTDNAAMIGVLGYYKYLRKEFSDLSLEVVPYLEIN